MSKILNGVLYIGAAVIVVGFVVGFYLMFWGDQELAKVFLGIIPVGFLVLFVGVVTNMLKD